VNLDDPNFERTPYDPFLAYGRSKTANILFAVAFDQRHRGRDIRAAAVHPGAIQTELGRHMDPAMVKTMMAQLEKQLAAEGKSSFPWKTIPQGAATSIWAAVVAPAEEIGGKYCENCHVGQTMLRLAPQAKESMLTHLIPTLPKRFGRKAKKWLENLFRIRKEEV
jgi:NAD(P)-dependent dehydrogenase (short-subunit alcohol dehydrogenase family)